MLTIFVQLVINIFFQVFYSSLGPDMVFQIWWVWHLLMFSIINILAPSAICYDARTNYPEFSGLKARRFPGQEAPRMGQIIPRRYLEKHQITSRVLSTVEYHTRTQPCTLADQSRNRKVFETLTIVEIH